MLNIFRVLPGRHHCCWFCEPPVLPSVAQIELELWLGFGLPGTYATFACSMRIAFSAHPMCDLDLWFGGALVVIHHKYP